MVNFPLIIVLSSYPTLVSVQYNVPRKDMTKTLIDTHCRATSVQSLTSQTLPPYLKRSQIWLNRRLGKGVTLSTIVPEMLEQPC